jgi:hypothetical protein
MSRAPLAGRPPFATDEPDTIYETAPAPQRRIRQPAPPDPNKRSSAYDMYNGYLGPDAGGQDGGNRISGVGGIGMGLLNMDDDSDSEDEEPAPKSAQSKHAALAAATARCNTRPLAVPSKTNSPPPPPKPIAAPQPGYAAPIAALSMPASPSPPHPQANPPAPRLPPALQIAVPKPSHPNTSHASPGRNPFADPSPSPTHVPSTPHPLLPPVTPITPAFARPRKSPGVTFDSAPTPRPTIRGNGEDTLLPARGEKGDDFWRRFSMVAKMPEASKESSWLSKTKSGYSQFSRWVWVTGLVLLILIGGAAGLGWWATHNKPDHQRPGGIGENADQSAPVSSSAAPKTGAVSGSSTVLKVTPTRTIDKRAAATPIPSSALLSHKRRDGLSRLS